VNSPFLFILSNTVEKFIQATVHHTVTNNGNTNANQYDCP